MPYNDIILWPLTKDNDFPSLTNNETSIVTEDERFYAEHYNKIRNFIISAYKNTTEGSVGTGDGSIDKLAMPYTFLVDLNKVLKYDAYDAAIGSTIKIPGNVLPFEFIITYSSSNYTGQINRTGTDFIVQKSNSTELSNFFGGISPIGDKLIATAQLVGNTDFNFNTALAFPSDVTVVISAHRKADTIILTGAVIDHRINSSAAERGIGIDRWKAVSSQTPFLKVSFMAGA